MMQPSQMSSFSWWVDSRLVEHEQGTKVLQLENWGVQILSLTGATKVEGKVVS